jgi:hypothetical protein
MAAQNTQFITLRSTDRISGSSGEATFHLPGLDLPKRHTVFLVSLTVPYTWYNVESPDNVFAFRETGAVTDTATFTITPGSYSSAQLAALLKTGMDAESPNSETYTVSYEPTTGKMTFATNDAGTTVEFPEASMGIKLFLAIGMYSEASGGGYAKAPPTAAATVTSSAYCQAGPSHLIVESNLRHRGHHTQFKATDHMATVPITAGPGSFMTHEPHERVELLSENDLGPLTNIRITWRRDDTGSAVATFNGVPWTITLGIRGVVPT